MTHHRVRFVKCIESCFKCRSINFYTLIFKNFYYFVKACLVFWSKLMKRWVKEANNYRMTFHSLKNSNKVFLLKWKNISKCFFANFFCIRSNHCLEIRKFCRIKEHMFCTAKTDSFSSKSKCIFCINRLVTISTNAKSFDFCAN